MGSESEGTPSDYESTIHESDDVDAQEAAFLQDAFDLETAREATHRRSAPLPEDPVEIVEEVVIPVDAARRNSMTPKKQVLLPMSLQ